MKAATAGLARVANIEALLNAGRNGQAVAACRELVVDFPADAKAQELLALSLEALGDRPGAEAAYRATLNLKPDATRAAARLGGLLLRRRRASEASAVLAPFLDNAAADVNLLTTLGAALKSEGRSDAAVRAYAKAAEIAPASGVAEHNLAGALADAHYFAESEAAARRAFAKGLDAPEVWLVRGRALQGQQKYDDAEAAFREAIARRPDYAEAHSELAQLIWMRTEQLDLARQAIDRQLTVQPGNGPLAIALARFLEYVGNSENAYQILVDAIAHNPIDPALHISASHLVAAWDPRLALIHADQAVSAAPDLAPSSVALCVANLAAGRPDISDRIAEDLCRDWPLDQYPVALAGTAWRLMGDPRYLALYDYARLVRSRAIDTPRGWPNLNAFLADLAARLIELQTLRGHPIGQSLRLGSQTPQSLAVSQDPVIRAFFEAIDTSVREYIAVLGSVDDRLGCRVTDGYRIAGAWSALLRPGGYHANHLHPMGWISSACHIVMPNAIEIGQQGWLKFGEPGLPTEPKLDAEHFVKPQAGRLVLFPSYMWHGTETFWGDEPRLTVAFDVLPD